MRPFLRRVLVAVAVVATAMLAAACGGSSAAPSGTTAHPGEGPSTMFTPSNVEINNDPNGTLDELKRLGVDSIHLYMHWSDIAPDANATKAPTFDASNPGAYPASGWAIYDTIIRDTAAHGMAMNLALVPPPPRWASAPGAPHPTTQTQWRPNAAAFGQWMTAVGRRYSGHYTPPGASSPLPRVSFWSIWNEPNLGFQLAPQTIPHTQIEVSGTLYRNLLDAGWRALHATGHGGDKILIGETGPAGGSLGTPGQFGAMAPLRFLRALYCVDANYQPLSGTAASQRGCPTSPNRKAFVAAHPGLFHASGFADHPYPQGLPPNEPTPNEPDFAELAEIGKLQTTLDRLQHVYGSDTRYPIYSTEFGYQTNPPDTEGGVVTPAQAADYLNWSEYLTWRDPRLKTYDQFLMTDSAAGIFASGLRFPGGKEKPGYAAFRLPIFLPVTKGSKGSALEVWGCVRPAHDAELSSHHPQHVRIQFAPSSGAGFKTVATLPVTDRYGYFDVRKTFSGSGQVRLAWTYPHGPTVYSRIVPITLR